MHVCDEKLHDLSEYFNVGGGVVYVGCTKCAYWEPHVNTQPIEVTITGADGSKTIHHYDGTIEHIAAFV